MKFRLGDRVKYLNEHGGGVVSKIVSSNMVYVKDADGFEIPTMTNELVLEQVQFQHESSGKGSND